MAGYYHDEDRPRFAEMGKMRPHCGRDFPTGTRGLRGSALTEREKCLIALGVAHAGSVSVLHRRRIRRRASRRARNLEKMSEAVHVASAFAAERL